MSILTKRVVWRNESHVRRQTEAVLVGREATNVRLALEAMHAKLGTWDAVGAILKVTSRSIQMHRVGRMKSGMAVRVAKAIGVPVGELLAGRVRGVRRFRDALAGARTRVCPHCGRPDPRG